MPSVNANQAGNAQLVGKWDCRWKPLSSISRR